MLYIARDIDGDLHLFEKVPKWYRNREWVVSTKPDEFSRDGYIDLPTSIFPEINWQSGPVAVYLTKPENNKSLDLNKLQQMLDNALNKETAESWSEKINDYLKEQKQNETFKQIWKNPYNSVEEAPSHYGSYLVVLNSKSWMVHCTFRTYIPYDKKLDNGTGKDLFGEPYINGKHYGWILEDKEEVVYWMEIPSWYDDTKIK